MVGENNSFEFRRRSMQRLLREKAENVQKMFSLKLNFWKKNPIKPPYRGNSTLIVRLSVLCKQYFTVFLLVKENKYQEISLYEIKLK